MFRRSRFSVRPNVGGAGRTPAPLQEAALVSQETKEAPKDVDENVPTSAATDTKPVEAPVAKAPVPSDANDPSGDGTSSSAAVQRRKRFSVKPRVAPGRLATLPRTPKSPVKVGSQSPLKISNLKPKTPPQAAPLGVQSLTPPEAEPVVTSCDGLGSAAPATADHSPKGNKKIEKVWSGGSLTKVPPRPPYKVAPLDKEAAALSEKARTLLSSKSRKSPSIPRFSLSRLLNDPSDIQRLEKAQKLRELLRQEMRKEKGAKRAKRKHVKEYALDPSKMIMRDLIHYLPLSNPMSSSVEDDTQENETVVPFSPRREKSPERVQKPDPEAVVKTGSQAVEEQEEAAEEEEEEDEEALMVPRVKVAEDGTLILDEESLTVEVQRAKGPNPAEDRDPIFERGSTTTYSSFRASTYCKPWTSEETDMFFLAISMVGTDFSMIGQLFHNRTRAEIRNKFKREERQNSWRIDKAFRERRKLDIEYFSKLLEKILEVQANRKKLKSLVEKNAPKKRQRRSKVAKDKAFVDELIDSEGDEDDGEIDGFCSSEAEDGEKENDELCKDGKALVSKTKSKRKRQSAEDVSAAKLKKMKSKAGEKSDEEDNACIPEDTEAAFSQAQPDSQVCESTGTDESSEHASVKPAKLSRGGAAKPVLPLGRKWSKKLQPPPPPVANAEDDASAKDNDGVMNEDSKEQMNNETSSPARGASEEEEEGGDDGASSGDDFSAKPAKPTRYGRVPKPPSLLNYPTKEEKPTSTPEPKCASKRARSAKAPSAALLSKKSKLITLRASQSESSDNEVEEQAQQRDDEEAFVPASLRSPSVVIPQVDETIENVIDYLSFEHNEVSEMDSYNEAAQMLLAIGNGVDLSQSDTMHDQGTDIALESGDEPNKLLEEEIAELIEKNCSSPIPSASSDHRVTPTNENSTSVPTKTESSPQRTVSGPDLSPTAPSGPQSRRGHSSEVKPKPNLAKVSRTAHSKSQPEASPVKSAVACLSPLLSKETASMIGKCDQPSENQTCDLTKANFDLSLELAAIEAKSTNAESGPNYGAALDVAVTEPQTGESNTPLVQKSGDHDSVRQDVLESQKSFEVQETRTRFPKVKPKPNISKLSRRARFKPQTTNETSLSANMESTCKTTADVDPQLASLETQDESISSTLTPIINIGSSVIPSEELNSSVEKNKAGAGHAARETKPTDSKIVESVHNYEMASDAEATESQAKESKAPVDQEGGDHDCNLQELPECQTPSKVISTHQTRGSRFPKVKPKPNLSQLSRNEQLKPETSKESSPSRNLGSTCKTIAQIEPQAACTSSFEAPRQSTSPASTVTPIMNSSASMIQSEELTSSEEKMVAVEHAAGDTKSTDADEVESGQNNESVSEPKEQESKAPLVQEGGDHATAMQAESEYQKPRTVLPLQQTWRSRFKRIKPNLPQMSRMSQSKPQLTKETCQSEVESQPTCTLSLGTSAQSASSTSNVTSIMNLSSSVMPSKEQTSSEKNMLGIGLAAGDKTSADPETVESGCNNETAEVIEPQAQELTKALDQEGEDYDKALPECQKLSEVVSAQQTRRSRFPKVKPKPNVCTSRTAHAKPQTTKEISLSPNLDSTCIKTAKVQTQPAGTSVELPIQSTSSASTVTPIINLGASMIPSEELTPSEQKMAGIGLAAGDTESTNSETIGSVCKNAVSSDAVLAEPQAEESNTLLDQEGGDHVSSLQELLKCQKPSEVVSAHQTTSRFSMVKPKPNLCSSRSAQAKLRTTKEIIPSPNLESTCKTTAEVQSQSISTFSLKSPSQSMGCASTVTPIMNFGTSTIHSEELTPGEQTMAGVRLAAGDPLSTDPETVESVRNNEAASDATVKETNAEESNKPLDQESGDHDNTVQELPERQNPSKVVSRRSRFPKVKPNLPRIPRGSLSKSQNTKETSPSSDPGSTCKSTAEVESQPTCSFSLQKQTVSSSTVTPITNLNSTFMPSEEISSSEKILGPESAARDLNSTFAEAVQSGCGYEAAAQSTSETCQNVPPSAMTSSADNIDQEDSEASKHSQEIIQRRRRLPKIKPNLRSPARATLQSKDGLDKPSKVTSDCQTVPTRSEARPQRASNEVVSMEMSMSTRPQAQSGETPTVGEETASNVAPHQETVTMTGPLNSTTEAPSLNIPLPDSVLESSGTSEANLVTAEAQIPKCTENTSLPKTSTTRRSRLVKPKPNLGHDTQPSRQEAVKAGSDAIDTSGPQEQTTVLHTPVEGADDQVKDACSTLASETRAPECPIQNESASSCTGFYQTSASLSIFPDTLLVPSDPDEPFFTLSLVEVPLDESPPQVPQADLTTQQSLPADSGVAGTGGSQPGVLCEEMGVSTSAVVEHPVLPAPPAESEDKAASAVTVSPKRRPKGFLSFLSGTKSTAPSNESRRGKAASCRPNVSKPMPRKRPTAPTASPRPTTAQTTEEPKPLIPCTIASQPSPSPSLTASEVSVCRDDSSVAVQEEPTNVSQYFLSDIFTEVEET
ncbi:transcription factor TFIIIB component B'' homolog isoform X1 [Phycodurus eques]|uniref:transcription factor TFIIIB component B'' homolog isoform X1 n=1 Tax=Phycodurus eques TaxID=693459 RepID=UPI002ACD411F|nr:transcription factor TFIIIB component B'' homolog isoform X1 [Phycodurus eques]